MQLQKYLTSNSSKISGRGTNDREINLGDIYVSENPLRNQPDFASVAIGHLKLIVSDIYSSADFFVKLGLRYIKQIENTVVLELRGGTHLILVETKQYLIAAGSNAPFDLMVDDIITTRNDFILLGLSPSEITQKQDHQSFVINSPDGYLITFVSSHIEEV